MHRALILAPLALLVPADAFACINSMYRDVTVQIATQPLEFLHFGVFVAAVVLLRWRGQPRRDELYDLDDVYLAPDARPKKKPTPDWPLTRQAAFAAVALLASFGVGLFAADALTISSTVVTERAVWGIGFLALGLATSLLRTGSVFLAATRKVLLIVALLMSLAGMSAVWSGEIERSEKVDPFYVSPDVAQQVVF